MSRDSVASHQAWVRRLSLPYPLLHDGDRGAARQLGLFRAIKVGGWTIDLFRRVTLLVDDTGAIAAVWGQVKIRGHATAVLEVARALRRSPEPPRPEAAP